jgi:HEAT repeat protein
MSSDEAFEVVLGRLRDTSRPVPTASLYHLSDLAPTDQAALETVWADLSTERRQAVIQDLQEISEANFEVNFESVFRLAMEDESPEVRAVGIRALWEAEDPRLMAPFLDYMLNDLDPAVRAAAASALGRFVYLGELEELPAVQVKRVEEALMAVIEGDDMLEVRRRALEAIAYSSRSEVAALIGDAYKSDEILLRVSALFAMGRSADAQWTRAVRAEMESPLPELRFEAARAAGELELTLAGPQLAELTNDDDPQVREAAIWSLGQIGGEFARETLNHLLEQSEDEDETDFIEEALENLDYTDEVQAFSLFEFDPEADDALDADDDLFDEDDVPADEPE